jgi:DNA segregation ATPase FtsK/SpoIIIE, S-DNA-T family
MLQRQYGMDFDDACKVLDELQELGLIGPYLGGQRRDILLTREQWLERVAQV